MTNNFLGEGGFGKRAYSGEFTHYRAKGLIKKTFLSFLSLDHSFSNRMVCKKDVMKRSRRIQEKNDKKVFFIKRNIFNKKVFFIKMKKEKKRKEKKRKEKRKKKEKKKEKRKKKKEKRKKKKEKEKEQEKEKEKREKGKGKRKKEKGKRKK